MATWWMGLPVGLVLALTGLVHKKSGQMVKVTLKAYLVVIAVAFITGLAGLAYGSFFLAETEVNWWLPENLIDYKSFVSVGSMHNFSYLGGVLGLLAGIIFSIKKRSLSPMV
ncbi:hypothetical protein RCC89_14510 [Cytophagaceae bacterium ABcell3]|nr:hypothetical protein RCC89_14510 [Cytophagaceae bacterium ABcell3]